MLTSKAAKIPKFFFRNLIQSYFHCVEYKCWSIKCIRYCRDTELVCSKIGQLNQAWEIATMSTFKEGCEDFNWLIKDFNLFSGFLYIIIGCQCIDNRGEMINIQDMPRWLLFSCSRSLVICTPVCNKFYEYKHVDPTQFILVLGALWLYHTYIVGVEWH